MFTAHCKFPSSYQENRVLVRNQPIFPGKPPPCSTVLPCWLPSYSYGRCVSIQVKGKLPKGLHCTQMLSRKFISPLSPSHSHTSFAISFLSLLRNLPLRRYGVSWYSGLLWFDYEMPPHGLMFGTLAVPTMALSLEAVKSSGGGAQLLEVVTGSGLC